MSYDFEFDFGDLAPVEIPVRYRGTAYVLREASEAAACAYSNAKQRAVRYTDGKATFDGAAESDAALLAGCLLRDGKPVPQSEILTWQTQVVNRLVARLKEVSGIEQPDTLEKLDKAIAALTEKRTKLAGEDDAKKAPPATTGSSA